MRYSIWITITIKHTYFSSDDCGLELKVSDDSSVIMKKAGILFRKQSSNQWSLIKPDVEAGAINSIDLFFKDGEQLLEFELSEKSGDFFYYTDWSFLPMQETEYMIRNVEKASRNRMYLQIPVTNEMKNRSEQIDITIPSRKVRWEFIIIPKYNNDTYPVELRESMGKLIFSVPEKITFPGEEKAYRSVTTSFVTMKDIYEYKISLWQKRDKGELLLSNHIPHPRSHSVSVVNPKEMITSYFYF